MSLVPKGMQNVSWCEIKGFGAVCRYLSVKVPCCSMFNVGWFEITVVSFNYVYHANEAPSVKIKF